MDWEMIGALSGLFSSIAALFALVAIVYAVRQTKEITSQTRLLGDANLGGVYSQVSAMMFEINSYFFNHPEWKQYFYDGVALPDNLPPRERGQIETLAEMLADFIDLISVLEATMQSNSPEAKRHWVGWLTYTDYIIASSPCLRDYLEARSLWYDDHLRGLASSAT